MDNTENNAESQEQNFIENNLLILSKQTMDVFLRQENPADVIALYTFYYYTGKWQKTNQPKCTDKYVKGGLHWGIDRVKKAQRTLINLGLIQIINSRDDKGKITGWYVKLNYIWKQETVNKIPPEYPNPEYPKPTSGKQETNALSANNINALNADTQSACADLFNEIETFFKTENDTYYPDSKNEKAIKNIIKRFKNDKQFIFNLIAKYLRLCGGTDKFWNRQPITPAAFFSVVDRVISAKIENVYDVDREQKKWERIGHEVDEEENARIVEEIRRKKATHPRPYAAEDRVI